MRKFDDALFFLFKFGERYARFVGFQNRRVNIRSAADGRRIAEMFGDFFDRRDDIFFRRFLFFRRADFRQNNGGEQRSAPRLARELRT